MGRERSLAKWFACLVLRLSGPQVRSKVRWISFLLITVIFVIGLLGWRQSQNIPDGNRLDLWTILYRTTALFVFDASGASPGAPPALQFARLAAPFAVAISSLAIAFTFAHNWANRSAARHSSGHRVLVGPPSRVFRYLSEGKDSMGIDLDTVHVHSETVGLSCSSQHLHVLANADWVSESGAHRSHRVILASGHDSTNGRLLGEFYHDAALVSSPEVNLEIDNHQAAVALALACVRERPDARIDVVDTTFNDARAVATCLAHEEVLPPSDEDSAPTIRVVVGRSPRAKPIYEAVHRALERQTHKTDSGGPRSLWIVNSDEQTIGSSAGCHVRNVATISAVESGLAEGPEHRQGSPRRRQVRAVVIDEDPDERLRLAVDLLDRFDVSHISMLGDAGPFPSVRMHALPAIDGSEGGLWHQLYGEIAERHGVQTTPSDEDPGSGVGGLGAIRHLMSSLADRYDFRADAADGVRVSPLKLNDLGPEHLDESTRLAVARLPFDEKLLVQLPYDLRTLGITLVSQEAKADHSPGAEVTT